MPNRSNRVQSLVAATYDGEFTVRGLQFRPASNGSDQIVLSLQCDFTPEAMAGLARLAQRVCRVELTEQIEPVLTDPDGRSLAEAVMTDPLRRLNDVIQQAVGMVRPPTEPTEGDDGVPTAEAEG